MRTGDRALRENENSREVDFRKRERLEMPFERNGSNEAQDPILPTSQESWFFLPNLRYPAGRYT